MKEESPGTKFYRIKLVSQSNIIVFLILFAIVLFTLIGLLVSSIIGIFIIAACFVFVIPAWDKYVTGLTVWQLTETGISIVWEKQFFKTKTPDYFFKWDDIEKIWKGMDPNYYNLKFRFRSGETITFFHQGSNDDFREFLPVLYSSWNLKKDSPG